MFPSLRVSQRMDSKEEEKTFFEALDNLKKPEWFRSCFFGNSRILASRIPGRLAPFFLAIQDEPDFFLEFCRKTRVIRIPTAWLATAAEYGRLKTCQALLEFQEWSSEEIVTVLSTSGSLRPEFLQMFLSSPSLVWTPFAVANLFFQGNLENQKRILQDPGFQTWFRELQGTSLFHFLEDQVSRLFGKEEGDRLLRNQKEIVRRYAAAQENLEFFLRPKL
jgi:hypothetical protein